MKITTSQLRRIIQEEIENTTVDEGFMSTLKKGVRKMRGKGAMASGATKHAQRIAQGWRVSLEDLAKLTAAGTTEAEYKAEQLSTRMRKTLEDWRDIPALRDGNATNRARQIVNALHRGFNSAKPTAKIQSLMKKE